MKLLNHEGSKAQRFTKKPNLGLYPYRPKLYIV